MDRFNLILSSLPEDPPLDLWDELREIGWTVRPLPSVLLTGLSDSEAKIIKTDLEILGAQLVIVPAEEESPAPVKEKTPLKEISDDEISFEELTLEIGNAPVDFKLPPAAPEKIKEETPLWELSLEDGESISAPPPPALPPPATKPQEAEIASLSFSLEDDHKPAAPPPPVAPAAPKIPAAEIASLSFSLEDDHKPAAPPPPIAASIPAPVKVESSLELTLDEVKEPQPIQAVIEKPPEVAVPVPKVEPEKIPEPQDPVETAQDSSSSVEIIDDDADEFIEEEEEEEEEETPAPPPLPKKKSILLGGSLLLVVLLAAYIFMPTEPVPPEGSSDSSSLVNSLLSEQERILKEERKQALALMKQNDEAPAEVIVGSFPIKLSDGALNGEIRFGRYQSGLLIDSLKISEEKQQKLSPQDLAAGKTPRPWLKKFELELPPVSAREQLGASYYFKAEPRVYVEDSNGTLRIPCVLELQCEFKAGANLSCFYDIKNKALYKKPAENPANQKQSAPGENIPTETAPKKTRLTMEREEALGFLVLISGDFEAKLNPQ